MTRRTTARQRFIDRETSGAIDFDAALEAYLDGGDPEELLRAASVVLGSTIPLDPEHTGGHRRADRLHLGAYRLRRRRPRRVAMVRHREGAGREALIQSALYAVHGWPHGPHVGTTYTAGNRHD